jgi:hypothetical protein
MKFVEWREAFLAPNNRKNLRGESFNGSPLYTYKMSALEFSELKSCLASNLQTYLKIYDINDICSRSTEFPALFVLYAANWWQRQYDGTGMNWDPIFTSIGINSSELNSNTRSQMIKKMIKKGFSYWNLTLNDDIGNLKFIGNIASQGGLPLKLIASDKNGNLNRLLKRTLKEVVGLAFPNKQSIFTIIEAHQYDLARSYRQPLIFDLLAEIIHTFLHLKNEAKLDGSENPLEKLNQFNASWRDSFPLPMDDQNAKGVLERFVQEGAHIKAEKQKLTLKLERYIKFEDDGFSVLSKVNLPEQSQDEESLKSAFGIETEFMSRVMRLEFSNQTDTYEVIIRRLAGQNKYRFDINPNRFFKDAISVHTATLKTDSGTKRLELLNSDELDDEIPWVFEADEVNEYLFLKAGAGKFKSSQLYVVIPDNFAPDHEIDKKGRMRGYNNRTCYLVSEETAFKSEAGDSFQIKPNVNDASNDDYVLLGNRYWDVFLNPAIGFKGTPQLNKFIQVSPAHRTFSPATAICRNLENKSLNNNLGIFGPMHLAVMEQNNSVWAAKIAVLPSSAKYNLTPGDEANQGVIELNDWGINNLKCLTEDVDIDAKKIGNSMRVDCIYKGSFAPDEFVKFEIFWAGNPKSALVQFPFPSSGVIAFNDTNHRLNVDRPLSLREIYGIRIISLLNQSNFVEIELSLKDSEGIHIDPFIARIKRDKYQPRLMIRVIDFKEKITDLLYSVDHTDSKVEFRVRVPGAKDFKIEITKYDLSMEHFGSSPTFSIHQSQLKYFTDQQIAECEVVACRIDEVDEVFNLNRSSSEGVLTGVWEFPISAHQQGCWMIFPSVTSSIQFRPMILPLDNLNEADIENEPHVNLVHALKIANTAERLKAINEAIEVIVEDFNHHDWVHITYLAKNMGHLNLTSLDIWRVFAKNKRAMAALALRDSVLPDHFLQRFTTESPFMWELVSIEAWVDAAFYLHKQLLQKWSSNEAFAEEYFKLCLNKKIDDLVAEHPSLRVVLEYIRYKNKLSISKDFNFLMNHPSLFEQTQTSSLFDAEDSELQKLIQCEANWPEFLRNEISIFKRSEHSALFCNRDYSHREAVINLPIIMAISALINHYPDWLTDESHFLQIKNLKQFDSDWFATAFDITVARAMTKGYVQL